MLVDSESMTVPGFLGRALSLELSAVQLYTTQARLLAGWGMDKAAERLRHEAQEEMGHVERIIARMLAHGLAPNASQLRRVTLGRDLLTLLHIDQQFEMELVSLYQAAVNYCTRSQNHDDRVFFAELLSEEQQHASELAKWIAELQPQPVINTPAGFSPRGVLPGMVRR